MSGVSVAARHLVGRESELEAIVELLERREDLPGVVVLPGEAGIGKTSLWLAGIEAASGRGYRVLSSRPSEAETRLSFAALGDLLGSAAAEVLPELPPIQRRALEAALLLGESESRADERAVGAAFLGALQLLAADGPACLAVDDVHWLDASSLAALRFALARLDREPVAALLTVRDNAPAWLRRAVPEGRLRRIEVGSLSVGAVQELLRARLDATFPRPTLIRLWETSGGNPFFAIELATALEPRGGALAPGEELPIPSDLDELLRARVDRLSAPALEVARCVAWLADPTVSLVESAVGPLAEAGLAETLAAQLLELDGERVRFAHPLLGSAVAARQTPSRRRLLHARLAAVVPTPEERARHLALATVRPSREVASILEEAAVSAHARGAPATAAELADHALRLTPPADADDARRRLFFAAERHHAGGDTGRALALLQQARADAAPGPERAAVLVQLAGVLYEEEPREAENVYLQALTETGEDDAALEATIQMRIADSMRWRAGIERGVAHAELAVQAASRTDDDALRCTALATHGDWHFRAGRGIARAEMEEALAIERALPDWPIAGGPTEHFCHQLVWAIDLDPARRLLLELLEVRRARRDPRNEAWAMWNLGFLEWRAGNWDEADRYAAGELELFTQLGSVMPPYEFPAAVIAAHQGRVEDARARALGAVARAEVEGIEIGESGHSWVLGFIEHSLGDSAAALEHLRRSYELRNSFMYEPGMRVELGDLLESLIATGDLDEADGILVRWEARAEAVDRAWALAILARCRGLLLAARGDLDGAFASFQHALREHDRSTDPFHHARTLLALGTTQRRAKRRGASRATLEEALGGFQRLGAPLWAEQARAELARIGGRTPTGEELTEAEGRIAALVAEGRTNREVAAALFLTVHSVETALTRVYRKLGVRSRTELASRYAAKT
jgi:DNA-binding CsgD family transcriptional regulator